MPLSHRQSQNCQVAQWLDQWVLIKAKQLQLGRQLLLVQVWLSSKYRKALQLDARLPFEKASLDFQMKRYTNQDEREYGIDRE